MCDASKRGLPVGLRHTEPEKLETQQGREVSPQEGQDLGAGEELSD